MDEADYCEYVQIEAFARGNHHSWMQTRRGFVAITEESRDVFLSGKIEVEGLGIEHPAVLVCIREDVSDGDVLRLLLKIMDRFEMERDTQESGPENWILVPPDCELQA